MQRDLRRLADSSFDLLVVGAGIYGALAAWDAAQRGLRVALVDRADFGAGTSFNSLKTLHGGLRSLQSLSLAQMRLFIRERRAMARMTPHLVRPLPFCVPTSGQLTRSSTALRTALAITDTIGYDRDEGVDTALRLPGGRVVGRDECLALNPFISPDGVTGGAIWYDYQMRQAERVVLSAVLSAVAAGAVAANHLAVTRLLRAGTGLVGAAVEDQLTGERFDVRATALLNATGPWAAELATTLLDPTAVPPAAKLSRAMNLVVDRRAPSHACGGVVDGRFLFLVPWRDTTILGTSHDAHDGDADAPHGTPDHVAALLGDAARAFPGAALDANAVRLVHRGLLPMTSANASGVRLLKESTVVDHRQHGHPGCVSIFSVRYTTARHTAEQAVDAVLAATGRTAPAGATATTPSVSARFSSLAALQDEARTTLVGGLDVDTRLRLAGTYGSDWRSVAALAASNESLAQPLSASCAITGAEVLYAAQHEAAVTLADVLLRRTEAGTAGHPGQPAIDRAAGIMAGELGWSASRSAAESNAVVSRYPPV